jgi:nucleotide-binding universal stress UspA family protein
VLPSSEPNLLVSAVAQAAVCSADFSPEANQARADKRQEEAQTFLQTKVLLPLQQALPNKRCEAVVLQAEGDSSKRIGQRIIKYAVDHGAAMVVMASHSKKPITEFFLGSVTSYCAHHSKSPVVILP